MIPWCVIWSSKSKKDKHEWLLSRHQELWVDEWVNEWLLSNAVKQLAVISWPEYVAFLIKWWWYLLYTRTQHTEHSFTHSTTHSSWCLDSNHSFTHSPTHSSWCLDNNHSFTHSPTHSSWSVKQLAVISWPEYVAFLIKWWWYLLYTRTQRQLTVLDV
jgi:hypothetical protein